MGKEVICEIPSVFWYYKDGSVQRGEAPPANPPSAEPGQNGVAFKDVTFNAELGLWARIYLPTPSPHKKLPLALFWHGGGFVMASPAWDHSFCAELAKRSGFIWVSASYRLAPEHRLPAALDDGISAVQWLRSQALLQAEGKTHLMDEWLALADFSKCFLVGESAGSNIIHYMLTLDKPSPSVSWEPLCIRGLVHIHPSFMRGVETRTQEERDIPPDILLNWHLADTYIDLALPVGESKENHPFYNPIPVLTSAGQFKLPKSLVALAENDCLQFMGREYIQALKGAGCRVDVVLSHGVGHCFYFITIESEQANILFERITSFLNEEC